MPRGERYPEEMREEARRLRREGWSLGEISKRLGPPKNTLTLWVRGIELTPDQQTRIKERESQMLTRNQRLGGQYHRQARLTRIQVEKDKAEAVLENLHDPHIIKHIAAAMLYLGEGAKADGAFAFANSNPRIITYWMHLMRTSFTINEAKFSMQILTRYDQDWNQLCAYWTRLTGIQRVNRSIPDLRTKGKPTKRTDYMGVCRINYYDLTIRRYLDALAAGLIERALGGA
jgi:hypothetical protein